MNSSRTLPASLACLIIGSTFVYTPTTRAIDPVTGIGLGTFAASLYIYRAAEQFDGPDRYNMSELKQALNDYIDNKECAKNRTIIRKNLYYLLIDGLIGHSSKLGSVRFNDKTGKHEIPAMPARGIYGYIHDLALPATQVAEFWKELATVLIALEFGKQIWLTGENPAEKIKEFVSKLVSTDPIAQPQVAALKTHFSPVAEAAKDVTKAKA